MVVIISDTHCIYSNIKARIAAAKFRLHDRVPETTYIVEHFLGRRENPGRADAVFMRLFFEIQVNIVCLSKWMNNGLRISRVPDTFHENECGRE